MVLSGLALAVWVIAAVLLWPAHGVLLNWDEVDYVNAAQLGPQANALERGSLSPIQFVNFALTKMSGKRSGLPAGYDERRDPLLLRHYHPPFVVFLLSAVSPFRSERLIRGVQLVGALALTLTIAFSYRSLSGSVGWSGMLLVMLLTLWLVRLLFASVSFHGWAAVWATTTAALLGRWLSARTGIIAFFLCTSLALMLLTLETGILVWAGAILCLVFWGASTGRPGEDRFPWRPLVQGTGLTTLFVVLVWPGSVIQASLLKIPALYAYRIWLGEEYAGVSGQWPILVRALVPLLVLSPLACLCLFLVDRAGLPRWGPFVVVGGLYGLALARFALQPQYLLPAFAPFIPIAGAASDRVPFRRSRLVLSVVTLLMIGIAWPPGSARAWDRRQREDRLLMEDTSTNTTSESATQSRRSRSPTEVIACQSVKREGSVRWGVRT